MRPKHTLKWLDATRLAATWEGNQSTHSTVWELISMWFFSDKWFLNSNTQEVNLRNRSEPQPKTVPSVPPICRRWTNSPVSQRCPWALRGNVDSHLILGESWRKDPSALTPHRCIADDTLLPAFRKLHEGRLLSVFCSISFPLPNKGVAYTPITPLTPTARSGRANQQGWKTLASLLM